MKQIMTDIKEATKELMKEAGINSLSGRFVFDENLVVQSVPFTIHKFENKLGYGFLLPKEVPVYAGKGNNRKQVGSQQIRSPAVITSDRKIIEPSLTTEKELKIKYISIPSEMTLRFELKAMQSYLQNTSCTPNGFELFGKIKNSYKRFLSFQNDVWYAIHSLWDIGTYFFELFNTYPIFELRGLSGTAKSKVMKVSRLFTLNPTQIMVNPSEASLFRITHSNRPTKYIDEAEKLFVYIQGTFQSSPVVELINGSYSKGSAVPRIEREGNQFKTIYYGCYSPTMVGSIAGLRDATETRAITHITTKAQDNDNRGEIEVEDYECSSEFQEIRNDLYVYALEKWEQIEKTYLELKVDNLKKRDFQLWKPILSIAKVLDAELYSQVLSFAEKLSEQKRQDFIPEGSTDYKILKVVSELLDINKDKIYVKEISENLPNNASGEKTIAEKTISSHMDKLGFKEYRTRDANGSFFAINKQLYQAIINPICPNLANYSS